MLEIVDRRKRFVRAAVPVEIDLDPVDRVSAERAEVGERKLCGQGSGAGLRLYGELTAMATGAEGNVTLFGNSPAPTHVCPAGHARPNEAYRL